MSKKRKENTWFFYAIAELYSNQSQLSLSAMSGKKMWHAPLLLNFLYNFLFNLRKNIGHLFVWGKGQTFKWLIRDELQDFCLLIWVKGLSTTF